MSIPVFEVVTDTAAGACLDRMDWESARKYLSSNAAKMCPGWFKALHVFETTAWNPGDAMSYPNGWIFCVNDSVDIR